MAAVPDVPRYQQLADRLAAMIQARSLRPGDRLPSVRAFSRQQRVSIPTALHAYATLESRGDIEARPKSGFFVRARYADTLPSPETPRMLSKRADGAALDPLESMMADLAVAASVPLGAALPGPDLLPARALQRTMSAIARRSPGPLVTYDTPPGAMALRQILARRSLEWGCNLTPDDFIVTTGCTEALSLALAAVCEPGDTVVVESPTYFGLARMLRDMGLHALPVPIAAETGLDVDRLAQVLRRTRVAACVLIPNFHNPVGCLMPDTQKRAVVTLLAAHGVPIIEDDIYGDLQHEGGRPRCLKAEDEAGTVMLCGSFSKTLAPGMRVGYIAPGVWYERVIALKRSRTLASATLPALAVADMVRNGGYDRHLRAMRRALRDRVQRVRGAVAEAFPDGTAISRPEGGFVLWVELPRSVDALKLFALARDAGISIAPGALFGSSGGFEHYVRLNCGHPWSPRLARAIETVGRLAAGMVVSR
jgi:DNA-binding transcriptional MocR family regulator